MGGGSRLARVFLWTVAIIASTIVLSGSVAAAEENRSHTVTILPPPPSLLPNGCYENCVYSSDWFEMAGGKIDLRWFLNATTEERRDDVFRFSLRPHDDRYVGLATGPRDNVGPLLLLYVAPNGQLYQNQLEGDGTIYAAVTNLFAEVIAHHHYANGTSSLDVQVNTTLFNISSGGFQRFVVLTGDYNTATNKPVGEIGRNSETTSIDFYAFSLKTALVLTGPEQYVSAPLSPFGHVSDSYVAILKGQTVMKYDPRNIQWHWGLNTTNTPTGEDMLFLSFFAQGDYGMGLTTADGSNNGPMSLAYVDPSGNPYTVDMFGNIDTGFRAIKPPFTQVVDHTLYPNGSYTVTVAMPVSRFAVTKRQLQNVSLLFGLLETDTLSLTRLTKQTIQVDFYDIVRDPPPPVQEDQVIPLSAAEEQFTDNSVLASGAIAGASAGATGGGSLADVQHIAIYGYLACASPAMKAATGNAQRLLTPWQVYDGVGGAVLGSVLVTLFGFIPFFTFIPVVMICYKRSYKEAAMNARFPGWWFAWTRFWLQGLLLHCVKALQSSDILGIVLAVLTFLVTGGVAAWVYRQATTVVPNEVFEEYMFALEKAPKSMLWAFPKGFWNVDFRRRFRTLFTPLNQGKQYFLIVPSLRLLATAVIAGVDSTEKTWCDVQIVILGLIPIFEAAAIILLRAGRVPILGRMGALNSVIVGLIGLAPLFGAKEEMARLLMVSTAVTLVILIWTCVLTLMEKFWLRKLEMKMRGANQSVSLAGGDFGDLLMEDAGGHKEEEEELRNHSMATTGSAGSPTVLEPSPPAPTDDDYEL